MQIPLGAAAEVGNDQGHGLVEIASDLAYKRLAIVNVVFYGAPDGADGSWTLIDAGVPGTNHDHIIFFWIDKHAKTHLLNFK